MCDCNNSDLIQALYQHTEALSQQTEVINAFALTVVQLTTSIAALIDTLDIPAQEESAVTETYMDGAPIL